MVTPTYLLGHTPLLLHGLENYLQKTAFKVEATLLKGKNQMFFPISSPILLLIELVDKFQDNLDYLRGVLKRYPRALLMVLNDDRECERVKAYFKLGVKAYVLPNINLEGIEESLRTIAQGQSYIDPRLSQLWARKSMGFTAGKSCLTKREKEVLGLIIEEYTTKEIAAKLYISKCTAETHRMNIIHKMGVRNTAGVVREALRANW